MACLAAMMHYLASTATFWLPPTKILKDAIYDKDAKLTKALHIMEAITQTLPCYFISCNLFSRNYWEISVSWKDGISPHWRPAACSWRHLGRRQKTEQEWNQMRRDVHQTTSNCKPSTDLGGVTFVGKKSCPQMEHLEKSQKGLF